MIELSIPQVGEESRNSKDLVFSILSHKQPQSAIEIYRVIRKQHNVSLTYQAIKKAIDGLVDKKVLIKQGKRYRISRQWLVQLKGTVDKLLTETGKSIHPFKEEMIRDEYAVYTLTSLLELDNFWDDLLIHLADHQSPKEPKRFLSHSPYGWWLLINLGREMKLFEHLTKRGLACNVVFVKDYPLNRWAEKIYTGKFGKFIVNDSEEFDKTISLNVIGDTVIQIKYPKKILGRLEDFYKKYESTQEMSMAEITKLANEQCEITFSVIRNTEIARSLYERHLKVFNQ